jgi:hypothetical protein
MYEDSHLEMAYEDRVSGPMGYEPDYGDWDGDGFAPAGAMLGAPAPLPEWDDSPEPYEGGPYTGDEPDIDGWWGSWARTPRAPAASSRRRRGAVRHAEGGKGYPPGVPGGYRARSGSVPPPRPRRAPDSPGRCP